MVCVWCVSGRFLIVAQINLGAGADLERARSRLPCQPQPLGAADSWIWLLVIPKKGRRKRERPSAHPAPGSQPAPASASSAPGRANGLELVIFLSPPPRVFEERMSTGETIGVPGPFTGALAALSPGRMAAREPGGAGGKSSPVDYSWGGGFPLWKPFPTHHPLHQP